MKQNTKKRTPVIILYIGAAVFFACTLFALVNTGIYMNKLVTVQSLDLIANISDVISYFVQSCAPYLFYGMMCYAAAVLVKERLGDTRTVDDLAADNGENAEDEKQVDEIIEESVTEDEKEIEENEA